MDCAVDPRDEQESAHSPPLFRSEALHEALGTQLGDALSAHWRFLRWVIGTSVLTLVGLIAFVSSAEYAPVYRVPAFVESAGGIVRILAPASGSVIEVKATEGQEVAEGQTLAVVARDVGLASGERQADEIRRELLQERRIVQSEIPVAETAASIEKAKTERRVISLNAERAALETEMAVANEIAAVARLQAKQYSELSKQGFFSPIQVLQKETDTKTAEVRVASLLGQLARIDSEISAAKAERDVIDIRSALTRSGKQKELSQLDRRLLESAAVGTIAVSATRDGIVGAILISKGQSVDAGWPLFTITSKAPPQTLKLLIPTRAAARARQGQLVQIEFLGFPAQKYGHFQAVLESVGDNPVLPGAVDALFPISEPVYVAFARLMESPTGPDGPLTLKPGMLAEALVPLERRTALEWILDPIKRHLRPGASQPSPPAR